MTFKALGIGFLVGGLMALSPSCGTTQCTTANCAGCCDTVTGICVNPATAIACGAGGNACKACNSNESCVSGTCTVQEGTTPEGGCSATTCPTGCCQGAQCMMGTSASYCGKGGVACDACDTAVGESCTNQVCAGPADETLGSSCSADADCAALGTGAQCRKSTATDAGTYAEGYCTKECTNSSECSLNGLCVRLSVQYDEPSGLCMKNCEQLNNAPGDCRQGYACYELSSGGGMCWIYPTPTVDAGIPADKIGQPCALDAECQNPPEAGGFCVPALMADGGPSGFSEGYCSADCGSNPSICSATDEAICITFSTGNSEYSICQSACQSPGTGQSDCRTGYVCQGYSLGLEDGGSTPSPTGICRPSCQVDGAGCGTGRTCSDAGYCE